MHRTTPSERVPPSPLSANPPPDADGILLVGHGTRDPRGVAEFLGFAEKLRPTLAPRPMEACFLEIAEPPIPVAMNRLIAGGVGRITVVPLLLTAAGHAKRDIPEAMAEVCREHPTITVRQTAALDCHPRIVDLSTRRFEEAVAATRQPAVPANQTLLLLVGRGSSDPAAIATIRRFAAIRAERSKVGRVETCFAAVAKPSVDEMLPVVAAAGFRRIVVQPHLLFHGRLHEEIREAVEQFHGAKNSDFATRETAFDSRHQTQWIVTEPLGPEAELVEAVVHRIHEVETPADPVAGLPR